MAPGIFVRFLLLVGYVILVNADLARRGKLDLTLDYGNGIIVMNQGYYIEPRFVQKSPSIRAICVSEDQLYTLVMYDKNFPTDNGGQTNFLHWLVVNIRGLNVKEGVSHFPSNDTLAPYIEPTPLKGSGLHEYQFELYAQSGKVVSAMHLSTSDIEGRKDFNVDKTLRDLSIPYSQPYKARFVSSYQDLS